MRREATYIYTYNGMTKTKNGDIQNTKVEGLTIMWWIKLGPTHHQEQFYYSIPHHERAPKVVMGGGFGGRFLDNVTLQASIV